MKIHKLSATFGRLHRQTLELKDGLNIIEAPNESGKSTWAGFLRAMLYGIDTRARDKKGFIAEKNLYQPWDGAAMEGSAQLSWNGREITLRRASKGASPLSQFQAVYTGTEEPVPGLTGDNAGELLTGVGREVFERSAFVGQSAMAVTGSAELERRISAIVSSGQEDVSYSETQQRLREWKNRRQSNQKNGLIPRLEAERAQVLSALERLERANARAGDARARIHELDAQRQELERQAAQRRTRAEALMQERRRAAEEDLAAAKAALDAVEKERQRRGALPDEAALRSLQGELAYLNTLDSNIKQAAREIEADPPPALNVPHPVFSGMEPAAVRERAHEDAEAVKRHGETRGALSGPVRLTIICILLLVAAAIALLSAFTSAPTALIAALAGAGVLAEFVLILWGTIRHGKESARVSAILERYGAEDFPGIIEQARAYIAKYEELVQRRTEAAVRAVTLERLQAEREELNERLLAAVHAFAPEVRELYGVSAALSLALNLDEKERTARTRLESAQKVFQAVSAQGVPEQGADGLDALRAELARQNEALAMAQGEMSTLGDPAALQARLSELDRALESRREELDALLLAMEGLDAANAALQERMSPALNRRAGELLGRLTGGVYDQVSLNRELDALASRQGDVTPRRLLTLSRGTADQLYLAVRLAVCDLVLGGEDPAPLVLDDALVNFDDERLKLALELLRELAGARQILLFTCQSRERLALSECADVNVIRLQS